MEQQELTREQVIANLQEAIEVQELQTKLQELRTKLILERFNEIKITAMYSNEFGPKPEEPETKQESTLVEDYNKLTDEQKVNVLKKGLKID